MRNNQPVSQHEYLLPANEHLVSVTDVQGRILYANYNFVEASGFSKAELLGQPHNIVRHPDMPQEAFRDLWATLKAGYPWSGLVKNRRKNGDHYWVLANATPIRERGEITGYLSVRVAAAREAIAGAAPLYAQMLAQEQAGRLTTVLRHGKVIRLDWFSLLKRRLTPGLQTRFFALMVSALVLVTAIEWMVVSHIVSALLALTVMLGATLLAWHMVRHPLRGILRQAGQLSAGDLTAAQSSGAASADAMFGDIHQALDQAQINIRGIIGDFERNIEQLRAAIAEIASGNMDMSSRTESQASSLQEAAASLEEINGTVKQSAEATLHCVKLASDAQHIARQSDAAVQNVAQTMTNITGASEKIGEMVHLIEAVAFQTNILALNAAVEAARAGETGRGFAVVAEEVRALAQRTAAAAQDIRLLIADSGKQVQDGNQRTQEARERVQDMLAALTKSNELLGEVHSASGEQRIGVGQVTAAVNQIDAITQQNAAMVQQLADRARQMHAQVEDVLASVNLFRLREDKPSVTDLDARRLRQVPAARLEDGRSRHKHRVA